MEVNSILSVHCCTVACRCTAPYQDQAFPCTVLFCGSRTRVQWDAIRDSTKLLVCKSFISSKKIHFAATFDFPIIFLPFTLFSSCITKSNALLKVTLTDLLGK